MDYSSIVCDLTFDIQIQVMVRVKKLSMFSFISGNEQNKRKKVTDKQKPVIVCKVCGQIFSGMNSFRVHKKKHLGIRYYCTR